MADRDAAFVDSIPAKYGDEMAARLAVRPGIRVLETACGTGIVTERLVARATKLPFDDRSFDAVVCQFGLMFFPDKAAGMREAFPGAAHHPRDGRHLLSLRSSSVLHGPVRLARPRRGPPPPGRRRLRGSG